MSIIFHVDVNSAFLSWTAVRMLEEGYSVDIRDIPSAIAAGDENSRHAIVLAKSVPAKRFGVKTADTIYQARKKCPDIQFFPPDFKTFHYHSERMFNLLSEYSPIIERFSIDECFIDYTASEMAFGDPVKVAHEIGARIKNELGFTVNVGVSTNKLLAKMASDFEKPDRVHTLFPEEIEKKMWPLPIEELFMVGRSSAKKFRSININTIGDLAHFDRNALVSMLKSYGGTIWEYANGIDPSPVCINDDVKEKSIGNSITTAYDVKDEKEAFRVLLWLSEKTVGRLRSAGHKAGVVTLIFKTNEFVSYSHQAKLSSGISTVDEVFSCAKMLFREGWKGEPLRLMGISLSGFEDDAAEQISFLQTTDRGDLVLSEDVNSAEGSSSAIAGVNKKKSEALEEALTQIRAKYGIDSVTRAGAASKKELSEKKRRR